MRRMALGFLLLFSLVWTLPSFSSQEVKDPIKEAARKREKMAAEKNYQELKDAANELQTVVKTLNDEVGKSDQHVISARIFDQVDKIRDFPEARQDVWGYGADQSTAAPLVDKALEWLGRQKGKGRFFTWLFHFDVHNWRELDAAYLNDVATRHGIPEAGALDWHYRVVAAGVDAEFRRLLDGLEGLGLADDTIVLFIADHGEALGQGGFWVHSVFLWESLLRVPLILRVPGLGPHVVTEKVSLIDIAPTLARYLSPDPDTTGYHGVDLLGTLGPDPPRRRLPMLAAGNARDQLVRLGVIDSDRPYKLVLLLEAAVPELYDLRQPDPDDVDVSAEHRAQMLEMLGVLVQSPVFPRTPEDMTTPQ